MKKNLRESTTSRVETLYEQLRLDIVSGVCPPDSRLATSAIAKRAGVSLSVVRESLVRLAENGLADFHPNRGFRVRSVSREDLIDLTEIRIMIETRALVRSIERGDVDWEAHVVATHHVLDARSVNMDSKTGRSPEWIRAHGDFHDALSSASGGPRLIQLVRLLRDAGEIYRQLAGPQALEGGRDIRAEHTLIKDLSVSRDSKKAVQALTDHLQQTTDLLLEHVFTGR